MTCYQNNTISSLSQLLVQLSVSWTGSKQYQTFLLPGSQRQSTIHIAEKNTSNVSITMAAERLVPARHSVAHGGTIVMPRVSGLDRTTFSKRRKRMMNFKTSIDIDEAACQKMILKECTYEWTIVTYVIADVMTETLERYGKMEGDLALEERLRYLATTGMIEIDDVSQPYGRYRVRLSETYRTK
ncbi:DUF3658 domain-containing protein [Pantoea piersonii]|uniref:DUF3658 domain-containing protein n=1 Tax=Pantoea piersonii TaxID=2364647 RepID=UPI0028ACE0A8|nr:DUF3658 domain-containing protein [Pantoea piersonii]